MGQNIGVLHRVLIKDNEKRLGVLPELTLNYQWISEHVPGPVTLLL